MTDNSYAVQHFGFSPKSIVDDVYSIWFDYTQKCLDDLKTTLQDKASGRIPPDELEANMESIFQEMVPEFNKNADKLEEFMQSNITHVPSHVLLPEDDVHRQLPDERRPSVSSLRAQLGSLHRRIAQGKSGIMQRWYHSRSCSQRRHCCYYLHVKTPSCCPIARAIADELQGTPRIITFVCLFLRAHKLLCV
ncbi:protein MIS12 homolog isoform X2 [Dermacentor andersoni]|uniref:protein MIS12 homolog isoform X2 n=1 Tax=Dermacentor andersoni TaxID=34620 RepID=UPI00241672BD|nr:protein MIS12 homolog isoform X2 [Dermacentor andersoni]